MREEHNLLTDYFRQFPHGGLEPNALLTIAGREILEELTDVPRAPFSFFGVFVVAPSSSLGVVNGLALGMASCSFWNSGT